MAAATDAVRICRSGWLGDRPRTASAAAIGIEHWGEANRAAADAVAPDYELPRPTDP
ncbi:MAG TPA: hypothetical protein VJ783_21215 [Pirellulales bacterium]|nr:hypothetical protein [Pirellulales bacterium]